MEWSMNEWLFYGGIAIAAVSLCGLILFLCIMQIFRLRLDRKLDQEYGKEKKE